MNKIIIFGGAFNPPHNIHFSLAEEIVKEYKDVEKIIFVPVNSKYQKSETLVANEHRYNMLKLVCDENEKFEVSSIELESERPLYTLETLNIFKEKYPDQEIIFLTGTDNLKEFHTWYHADEIIKKFKVLVLDRDTDQMEDIIALNPFLNANKDRFIKVNQNIRSNLSSTYVREQIRSGNAIKDLVPNKVYEYIKENKLYEVM